jgi:hypothetical protein
MGGACSTPEGTDKCLQHIGCKARRGGPLGRLGGEWVNDIEMDLVDVRLEAVDWIDLAQDRGRWWVVNTVIILSLNGRRGVS